MTDLDVRQFLIDYGYLSSEAEEPTSESIAAAQVAYGLPETGVVDDMTKRVWLRAPRCGRTDAQAAGVSKWGIKHLKYRIDAYPTTPGISKEAYRAVVRKAFDFWSEVCGLTFEEVGSGQECHVRISTGRGRRAGFDGPSGTLAMAELPGGTNFLGVLDMWIDLDEFWVIGDDAGNGIYLLNVLCHEIGHIIGLDHDTVRAQLMNPSYSERIAKPQANDAKRAQSRYGAPAAPKPTPTPTPGPSGSIEVRVRVGGETGQVYAGSIPKA
jgi:hypothetical protein